MRRFLRRESGAAIVEFALVVPILMLVVFGAIDLSRAFYARSVLRGAVQDGARLAAVLEDPVGQSDSVTRVVTSYLERHGTKPANEGRVSVLLDEGSGQVAVRVSDYEFQFLTPLSRLAGGDRTTMTYEASAAWERGP
jgi:Flp pilus assembly protein TadG